LGHYLYGELEPPQALAVMGHLERCGACREEFARLQRVYQALELWQEIAPPPELRRQLLARVAAERAREPCSWRQYLSRDKAVLRTLAAVLCGIAAAVVSVLIVTGNVLTSPLPPQTFLICGILWGGIYIALFRLALARSRPGLRWRGVPLDLTRVAAVVLAALGIAVLSTFVFPLLSLADVRDIRALFGGWLRGWPDQAVYFVFGSVVALLALLFPTRLLGGRATLRPLRHGLLVGCVFTIAVAPGLTILCVPFTLGVYLSALLGSAAGALAGGTMGSWWALRPR
jgi:hypothetical protein